MGTEKDEVSAAIFLTRTLMFLHTEFKNIKIDLIKYHIVRAPQNYIYVCKGMKPDCVFLLIKVDAQATLLSLGRHWCDIIL